MNEQEILKQLKGGDKQALRQLMLMYQDYVYTISLRMVKNSSLAEEITQDVFLRVYYKIGSFREESRFTTWLFTIVYRTCLNHLSKKENKEEACYTESDRFSDREISDWPGDDGFSSDDEWTDMESAKDLQIILWKAIDLLDQLQGVIISLFYLQEFSVTEISEITGIPVNSVKTHLHRGRKNLKKILLKSYIPEDLT